MVKLTVQIKSKNSIVACRHLIRLGDLEDGGYVLCSESVMRSKKLLSFGISDNWSFESEFIKKNDQITVDCYDFSISLSIFLGKAAQSLVKFAIRRVSFQKLLSSLTCPFRYCKFFRGRVRLFRERVSILQFNATDSNIDKIFSRIDSSYVYLKMDIEGTEYKIIPEIMSKSSSICGMTIEFHDVYYLRKIFLDSLNLISEKFDIVHVHGNNFGFVSPVDGTPDVIEMSFVPKHTHHNVINRLNAPIVNLDFPNNPLYPDYVFSLEES